MKISTSAPLLQSTCCTKPTVVSNVLHELKLFFMQTTKRSTGPHTAASNYETLVQQAINKVTGFEQLYKELDVLLM